MPVYKWSRFLARTDRTGPTKGSTRGPRGPKNIPSLCFHCVPFIGHQYHEDAPAPKAMDYFKESLYQVPWTLKRDWNHKTMLYCNDWTVGEWNWLCPLSTQQAVNLKASIRPLIWNLCGMFWFSKYCHEKKFPSDFQLLLMGSAESTEVHYACLLDPCNLVQVFLYCERNKLLF